MIFAYDPEKKILDKEPVFVFDKDDIADYAKKHDIKLPGNRGKSDSTEFKFNISAIALHPFSGKLYLLSAADHALFVFSKKGKLEHIEMLDPKLFNKPEGITFHKNGDMFITNEGQDKKATLLIFGYR